MQYNEESGQKGWPSDYVASRVNKTPVPDGGIRPSGLSDFHKQCIIAILNLTETTDSVNSLDIRESLEGYYNRRLEKGVYYGTLDALVDYGYVETADLDGNKQSYSVTNAGRAALASETERAAGALGWEVRESSREPPAPHTGGEQ